MKKLTVTFLIAALAALVLAPHAFAQEEKPRIAVLEFEHKAGGGYWWQGGAEAMQDVFVTELVKSGKFRVIDREQLNAMMRERGLATSGDLDPASAVRIGKMIGADYFLTGAVTEYGVTDKGGSGFGISIKKRDFVAAANARLIDVETGEIVWADEARAQETTSKVRVRGVGGGVDDQRMFDKVMKPVVQELTASLKAADI